MTRHVEIRETPVGRFIVEENGRAVTRMGLCDDETAQNPSPLTARVFDELSEYLRGERRTFDFPIEPEGTGFQKKVWAALREIPYGETRSYGQVARDIGCPGGSRAVGMANHRNRILIAIPCHRVIGADGSLTGYGAGLTLKARLLALEKQTLFPGED